ncbi:ATP synthase F0 subunit B [Terriglobus albidus]|uniref:ATP synthase subunit b n=1 Tax=Terriglobus albidus TaxID=1592106 RepID=A0A5B9E6M5_9BACT|nr:ATP synthase F0 subunit B [Terriglobus albidus]QEE27668.1 ATP synthase F0 subunit B [Terriglobus albidus]
MNEILATLSELVLGSVPTIVLFTLVVIAYSVLVRRPLEKTLSERRARTSGAMEQAKSAVASAESKTSEYEERLRIARAEIFEARQKRVQQFNAEREAILAEAREQAQTRVTAARQQVEQSLTEAKKQIEVASEQLSAQVLKAILPAEVLAGGAQ